MRKKILFITGSMNQTSQMLRIAAELSEHDCWFSQMFTDSPVMNLLLDKTSLIDKTIIAHSHRKRSEAYLKLFNCQIDYKALQHQYDLVVFCSDLIVPQRLLRTKTIWIQEGMIDRMTWLSRLVKALRLPPTLCFNTSLNGATDTCDLYCAASEGYREHLARMGTKASKIVVTGIPNYDNAAQYLDNDFPHRDYIMVATSDMRETARPENRPRFISYCAEIAKGRQLLFKLHPNENFARAIKEIRQYAPPDTLIYTEGNTDEMIANCTELITQYSTVVYTGIALGKKVYSYFDVEKLKRLAPLQNGGRSANNIAQVCRSYLQHEGSPETFSMQHNKDEVYSEAGLKEEEAYAG